MSSNQHYATQYYKKFAAAEGNQHIASLFALKVILDIVKLNKPQNILEIGLGIGSISYSIFEYAKSQGIPIRYHGTEKNDFCLQQLPVNLGGHYPSLHLFSDLEQVPKNIKYDLMIIDGSDDSLENIKDLINPNGIIFIEGDRKSQLQKVQRFFSKAVFVNTIATFKDPDYGPFSSDNWSGGGKLLYLNPNFKQKLHYFKERIRTAYINRVIR